MSNPEDDIHNENVLFLRDGRRYADEMLSSRHRHRRRHLHSVGEDEDGLESSDTRTHRTPAGASYRIPIVRRPRGSTNNSPNYESTSQHLNSVYGWAPADEEGSTEADDGWSGNSQGSSSRDRTPTDMRNPGGTSRALNRDRTEHQSSIPASLRRDNPALVTAALLQSVRRHPRFSPRARTLQNYILDSEIIRHQGHYRHDNDAAFVPNPSRPGRSSAAHRAESETRRMYLKDPSVDRLKETIQYLDRVRFSNSYEESMSTAAAGGFVQDGFFQRNGDDFILNTGSLSGPDECSWLRPGTVFSGQQQATYCSVHPPLAHRNSTHNRGSDPVSANGNESQRISVYTSSGRGYFAHDISGNDPSDVGNPKTEQWPVKVTIHDIDYKTMTLSGTMEAYNIPDKTSSNQGTHIITYLEGEIIDFNTHTLETKNFQAGPEVDSCYWRELEPFKNLTYDQIAKSLVSKKWITEKLSKGWILMRWKGKCFYIYIYRSP